MMGTIIGLELRQRVRGASWYVLLAIWIVIIAGVTFASWQAAVAQGSDLTTDLFSFIAYFVLLMALLVTPAIAGGSVNGDRQDGVLATTQVTLITARQIVWGKFFAALIISVTFLAGAAPALAFAAYLADVHWSVIAISLGIILAEMAVICAIGVGLSGLLAKPLFSVVATYLILALFSIGTLIGFGLATSLTTTTVNVTVTYETGIPTADGSPNCVTTTEQRTVPHTEYTWWSLALNPFVIVADATPTQLNSQGYPEDLFGMIRYSVRQLQLPTETPTTEDWCTGTSGSEMPEGPDVEHVLNSTWPSWFVGLGVHVVLGFVLMAGAVQRTKTPITKLPKGQRIA